MAETTQARNEVQQLREEIVDVQEDVYEFGHGSGQTWAARS